MKKILEGPKKNQIYDRTETNKCETLDELRELDKKMDDQKEFENLVCTSIFAFT